MGKSVINLEYVTLNFFDVVKHSIGQALIGDTGSGAGCNVTLKLELESESFNSEIDLTLSPDTARELAKELISAADAADI